MSQQNPAGSQPQTDRSTERVLAPMVNALQMSFLLISTSHGDASMETVSDRQRSRPGVDTL
jgi:hypothetical protein